MTSPTVAVTPIRGGPTVIASTMKRLSRPPIQSHAGSCSAATRPWPRSTASSRTMPPTKTTTVENAIAGTTPIRSPSSPITAACIDPARPAVTDSATASPAPLDTARKLYARRVADGGSGMVRVMVLYEVAPPGDRYAEHVELCRQVEGATFRHGAVFGTPTGDDPDYG